MRARTMLLAAAAACLGSPAMVAADPAPAASAAADPAGDWTGTLPSPQGELKLGFHFSHDVSALAGTIDVPQFGAIGAPLDKVSSEGGGLAFELPQGNGHYSGSWDPARKAYVGEFQREGAKVPLVLTRGKLPPPPPVDWNAPAAAGLGYAPAAPARPTTGIALPVGKCMNMANQLEGNPAEGSWGPKIADDDFRIIKAAGFATVRIPVRWSGHSDATAPYRIDPAFLKRVHHVVDLALASGLNVILDLHHYDEIMTEPEANAERFGALWRQIATSFASAPPSLWFELLNEPHDKLTDANLPAILARGLAAVRESNPTRPVVIGGEQWSGLKSLATLKLPDDPYVVPTFHYYDPFAFTHQGATWMKGAPPFGRAFGSAADKAALDADLATLKGYMTRTGRVPFLGEYGATDDGRLPIAQRARYYHSVSSAFASIGVASCAWGYRSGFKMRDGDHWLPGLVESASAPAE